MAKPRQNINNEIRLLINDIQHLNATDAEFNYKLINLCHRLELLSAEVMHLQEQIKDLRSQNNHLQSCLSGIIWSGKRASVVINQY